MIERWRVTDTIEVVRASDYDALLAELNEAKELLRDPLRSHRIGVIVPTGWGDAVKTFLEKSKP